MPKNLVIVESPAKSKTISKFLGSDYTVLASMGHVRDLPKSAMGIDTEKDFEPKYSISPDKKTTISKLKAEIGAKTVVWLATDEDREGEAIGWHLAEALKIDEKKNPMHRIVFHEITKTAIEKAIATPRKLDMNLVDAQQARRILDRLVGYELSPLLWKKIKYGLSAGRVQSVAVRLVVERERAIQGFKPVEFWRIKAHTITGGKKEILFELIKEDGKKSHVKNEKEAEKIIEVVKASPFVITSIEKKNVKRYPSPPFITSTLQQEAARKLGFSVKKTMIVAQQLYEGIDIGSNHVGLITYMRTDSFNLANEALGEIKKFIEDEYGKKYSLAKPRTFKGKKGAQEAHEAIRPTHFKYTPEEMEGKLDRDQHRLYELIWKRAIACQMSEAEMAQTAINVEIKKYLFRANGQIVIFDGFMKMYTEGKDEDDMDEDADDDGRILPEVKEGEDLKVKEIEHTQHFTKPPARYTEASLVKKLESEGIGRPSTYAPTISTVIQRGYVENIDRALHATNIGMVVTDFLVEHFSDIVDYQFTAKVEEELDDIAEGKIKWVPMIKGFYTPFHKTVEDKTENVKREDVMKEKILGKDPKTKKDVIARHGKFGPYVQIGEWEEEDRKAKINQPHRASLPNGSFFETITLEEALQALSLPRIVGKIKGEEVLANVGPYGPYLKLGKLNASLPEGVDPHTVTIEEAKKIIEEAAEKKKKFAEPIKVFNKKDPESGGEVEIKRGRFGPYITDGKTNAAIPKGKTPQNIDFETAVELLEKKRKSPKKQWKPRGNFKK
ncbi:MAG: type I DNA topoisomerase [Candidatus Peregrinibacteria bacterium]|nr:type I DNA topoisomerase [Candidatus Peregrinibacteria bacterium]MDZ4245471.1 type I DNA topoisomerase [Candidatus Gracilibacteria bacterium]